MGIERLWPLALACFIPGIILLYMLRQKAAEQKVPALNLWREAYENARAFAPWEKFYGNILMYMQIAALLLLIAALMSPYIKGAAGTTGKVILIIDNSASMGGLYSGGKTKLDAAKKKAVSYINSAKGAKFTIISSSDAAAVEAGTFDKKEAADAVYGIEDTDKEGSAQSGVDMAASIASAWDEYEARVYTDADINLGNLDAGTVDLSAYGSNAAVGRLSHSRTDGGRVRTLARVDNLGADDVEIDVSLYVGEEIYDVKHVYVEAGESRAVYFNDMSAREYRSVLSSDTPYFKAEINSRDMVENDNFAYEVLNEMENEKLLLVSDRNSFLENAARLFGSDSVDKAKPGDVNAASGAYSLIIYDGVIPDSLPKKANLIFINPYVSRTAGERKEWERELFKNARVYKNAVISAAACGVTKYMEDYSFSCLKTKTFSVPPWAKSFFIADGSKSAGYFGSSDGRKTAVIGFDLHDSDFALQPQFPIFMYNLFRQMSSSPIARDVVYYPGKSIRIYSTGDLKKAAVSSPDGERTEFDADADFIFGGAKKAGLYSIEGDGKKSYFCVKFPESESDVLLKPSKLSKKGVKGERFGEEKNASATMTAPILAVLLALLMAEWAVYVKRL